MRTSDFDYDLPERYIAQTPLEKRDQSRLLVLDRHTGAIEHRIFHELGEYLRPADILVINETRVIPGRLFAHKLPGGGRVEILLLKQRDAHTWEAIVGGGGMNAGRKVRLETSRGDQSEFQAEVLELLDGASRLIRFDRPVQEVFSQVGHVPLPPYVHARLDDPERYQTVYARSNGSAAAPTAGLHFTHELMTQLKAQGIQFAQVTLHVGLDTFAPVNEADPLEHRIHSEWCRVTQEAVEQINLARQHGGRVIAVGTTAVRTLESAARSGTLLPYEGATELFILPGYQFNLVEGMVTNFHLPRSTLIMLVSAFAGRKNILNAYEAAKRENYRFYSFGDAMLII